MKNSRLLYFLSALKKGILATLFLGQVSQAQTISTFAGTGTGDYASNNNIPATSANMYFVSAVTSDAAGNIYLGGNGQANLYKVTTDGIIHTIAGVGMYGDAGDGGSATSARMRGADGICLDSSGNIYFSDVNNNKIRKIDRYGIISTVAGIGSSGFSGDGGVATAAQLNYPSGICLDNNGSLIIADRYNNRVRKVSPSGIISTIAGGGSSSSDGGQASATRLYIPTDVCVSKNGELFIADFGGNKVLKVNTSGIISTYAGNGTYGYAGDGGMATAAQLENPASISLDNFGNLYISENYSSRIRVVNLAGKVTTMAGLGIGYGGDGGQASAAHLNHPTGLCFDGSGNLIISDQLNYTIRKVTSTGIISTIAGVSGMPGNTGEGGQATAAKLFYTRGVASDGSGNIYIADFYNNKIKKINTSGVITTIAGTGASGYSGDGGAATAARIWNPAAVCLDASGNIYIAETGNNCVRKVNSHGIISTIAGNGSAGFSGDGGVASAATLNAPSGLCMDNSGNLYISDGGNNRIRKINASGIISTIAGGSAMGFSGDGGQATNALLLKPYGICLDVSGNIYFADYGNGLIRKINTSGVITSIAGTPSGGAYRGDGGPATAAYLWYPHDVAVDGSGNIFIADYGSDCIRKVNTSGIISTVVGIGNGYSGDGGAATDAKIFRPLGIHVARNGDVYIADRGNARVRKVTRCTQNVPSITGPTSMFVGSSISLGNAISGGSWRSSNPSVATIGTTGVVYGVSNGTSGITYSVSNNCGTSYSLKNITVNAFHTPHFLSDRYTVGFCNSVVAYSLNNSLRVSDIDAGKSITWSLVSAPAHGTASVAYTATSSGGIITPAGLTYSVSAGYTGLDSFTVRISDAHTSSVIKIVTTIFDGPAPASISGPSSVCEGATITLISSIAGGTWSTENNLATVSSSGVVTGVRGTYNNIVYYTTNSARCGVIRASHPITINRVPEPSSIAGTSTVAVGNSATLTSYTAGGTWSSSASSIVSINSSGLITGTGVGVATISYSVTNVCGIGYKTKSVTVTAHRDENAGTATENTATIRIYPNPNSGQFILELPESTDNTLITIIDINGKVLSSVKTTNTREEFNIQDWAKGIYIINVLANNKHYSSRLVID